MGYEDDEDEEEDNEDMEETEEGFLQPGPLPDSLSAEVLQSKQAYLDEVTAIAHKYKKSTKAVLMAIRERR